MTKHTPGPWVAVEDSPTEFLILARWCDAVKPETAPGFGDYRGIHIARVRHNIDGAAPQEHAKANAKILAAAPDLLEALKKHAEWIERDKVGAIDDEWDYDVMVGQYIRAAIAKAEG